MPAYTHNLIEDLTYWPPDANTASGGSTFGAPVAIKGRWQDRQVLFRDAQGRERVSEAVVYVDRELVTGGYLYRGVSSASSPVSDAKEIRQKGASPSLDGDETLYKVNL